MKKNITISLSKKGMLGLTLTPLRKKSIVLKTDRYIKKRWYRAAEFKESAV